MKAFLLILFSKTDYKALPGFYQYLIDGDCTALLFQLHLNNKKLKTMHHEKMSDSSA
jgi:hypothetical protein